MRINTTQPGPEPVPEANDDWQRVLLIDGPYDGQDIRASGAELRQGLIVRDKHQYARSGVSDRKGTASAPMPLFRWLQEARIVLLPFLAMPYGL